MDDFLVAGPADSPEDVLALMRTTAIASFGEAVREIARENFRFCDVHRCAVPRVTSISQPIDAPDSMSGCICPAEPVPSQPSSGSLLG